MKKFQYIEMARGVAALLVVLHHATLDAPSFYGSNPFGNFFYFGMAGVDFFFVLSGFIIYYIHADDVFTLNGVRTYVLKRIIRIYPIFLIVSLLLLSAYMLLPHWSNRENLTDISFLITSFLLLPSDNPPLLSVSWTLVHEMFFYSIFIFVIWKKNIGLTIFILWGITILYASLFLTELVYPYSFYLSNFNLEFLLGVIVAAIIRTGIFKKLQNYAYVCMGLGLMVFLFNGMNVNYQLIEVGNFRTIMFYGISSAMIIYGLVQFPKIKKENFFLKMWLLLGSASYSIYLVHYPVQQILNRGIVRFELNSLVNENTIFLMIVIVSTVGGIVLHLWLEKPILKYLRKKFIR
jgi:peptidoglycan/LPS O-acetylase OafA/YrhL